MSRALLRPRARKAEEPRSPGPSTRSEAPRAAREGSDARAEPGAPGRGGGDNAEAPRAPRPAALVPRVRPRGRAPGRGESSELPSALPAPYRRSPPSLGAAPRPAPPPARPPEEDRLAGSAASPGPPPCAAARLPPPPRAWPSAPEGRGGSPFASRALFMAGSALCPRAPNVTCSSRCVTSPSCNGGGGRGGWGQRAGCVL